MKNLPIFYKGSLRRHLKGELVLVCLIGFIFFSGRTMAKNDPVEDFDEILIQVQFAKLGGMDIPAAFKDEDIFLSVTDLFDFLHIKYSVSSEASVEGFILNPSDKFIIDLKKEVLQYKGKEHVLSSEAYIRQIGLLYLKNSIFGEIFGLDCSFDFRSLSVSLSTEMDLPVLRLKRQEMLRKNLNQLQEKIAVDTVIQTQSSLARLSMVDWGVTSTQQFSRRNREDQVLGNYNHSRVNLSLGGELAYGELTANLNFIEGMPFQHRNQFYQWRYVNNDNALAKQIMVGRINSQATSTLYAPITGIQVTNASTLRNKSFGSYRISDHTEPEWLVELYVNNLLIDYVQADATGFYSIDVPLMYGHTAIQLKFYGPYGEEHSSEQFFNIPFNFLPKNEVEYSLSSGLVEDRKGSVFSRGSFNYGLSNDVTLGGGVEFLSSLSHQPFMPFVQSSIRLADGLMFSADYMPGIRTRGILNYRLPSNLQLDLTYTKLEKDQKAIFYNYLQERKVALSMPIKGDNFSLFTRLGVNQIVYPTTQFTTAQWLLSSMLFGVNTQLSTFGTFHSNHSFQLQTQITQNFRLPGNISFIPQLQYNYSAKKVSQIMAKMEKRVFKRGYLNAFYQNNLMYKNFSFGIGFRFDFSFANTSMQMRQTNDLSVFTQTAWGSMMYDVNTHHLDFNNKANVGKGAITVLPFLDLNANGKRDHNESLVQGLKLKVGGGQVHYDKRGESIRITNLSAYEDYILELDKSSFDNIAWRIKNAIIKVKVKPNQFKKVEVPISVMGEAAGMVYLEENLNGIGRIKMNFYDDRNNLIQSVLTEKDGYFSYMDLAPGNYRIIPDSVQMQALEYTFQAEKTSITIAESAEGDYLDDLEFFLSRKIPETSYQNPSLREISPDSGEGVVDIKIKKQELLVDHLHENKIPTNQAPPKGNATGEQLEERNIPSGISSDSIQVNPLRFTLKNSNPALLEKLMGKSLDEQKQLLNSINDQTALYSEGTKGTSEADQPLEVRSQKNFHPDTYFRIQILSSEKVMDLGDPFFSGIKGIDHFFHEDRYRYTYGIALKYEEAVILLNQVQVMGFEDALIVPFYKRRPLE